MRKIKILLLIILFTILTSCGAYDNEPGMEGVSYDYYETCIVDGVEYLIYLPTLPEDAIYYVYEEGNDYTDKSSWTINYIYEAKYQIDDDTLSDDVLDSLYTSLIESKSELKLYLGSEVNLVNPHLKEEREVTISNENKEVISYVVLQKYLSVRVRVNNSGRYYNIGIPLEELYLKRTEETVYSPIKNEMILWKDFLLTTPNLYQK